MFVMASQLSAVSESIFVKKLNYCRIISRGNTGHAYENWQPHCFSESRWWGWSAWIFHPCNFFLTRTITSVLVIPRFWHFLCPSWWRSKKLLFPNAPFPIWSKSSSYFTRVKRFWNSCRFEYNFYWILFFSWKPPLLRFWAPITILINLNVTKNELI